MKHRITRTLAACAILAVLVACRKDDEAETAPAPVKTAPADFVPPPDGLLKPEQAARWRQGDSLVRLVDSVFLDSIRQAPDRVVGLQAQQDVARDLAVRKAGLLGWKEYRWVLDEAAKLPANAAAFQAAGLAVPQTSSPSP